MVFDELSNPTWARVAPVNANNNGFPARINTVTQPSGTGVVEFGGTLGGFCPRNLVLLPYGTGVATNTFLMNILGWRATALAVGQPLWTPIQLGAFTVTLGTGTGVAGADLDTTALFATTITTTYGPTFVTAGQVPFVPAHWFELSPGTNVQGAIVVPSLGFRFLEVIFSTGASATGCNALYCKL